MSFISFTNRFMLPLPLLFCYFLHGVLAFSPIWIGPRFREDSFVDQELNDELEDICGRQPFYDSRSYPWAVSIMLKNRINRLGGSIISPYHILTVAHGFMKFVSNNDNPCIAAAYRTYEEVQQRIVAYGGRCIRGYSNVLPNHPNCTEADVMHNKIRSVMVDQGFVLNGCHDGHDWAIIELEEPINFTEFVAPICLPPKKPIIDNILTVAGWGRSYVFNESGPMIHEIPMIVDPKCDRPWSDKLPHQAADFLCATSLNKNDYFAPRTCHGDSGSGMEQIDERGRSVLIAMTSFGTIGCPANELARFTRVDHYLHQICTYTGVCYSS